MDKFTTFDLDEDTEAFLSTITDANNLEQIILYANKQYEIGEPVIFDDTYDLLVEKLQEIKPNSKVLKKIGAEVDDERKTTLPYHMGSMSKVKAEEVNVFNRWTSKFKGPYMKSLKMDGVSALFVVSNNGMELYTRGNGTVGAHISHLINYIQIDNLKNITAYMQQKKFDKMVFRGELIMSKNTFYQKYADPVKGRSYANPRNMVAGLVNAKTLNIPALKDVQLIFYEVIEPWQQMDRQFEILTKMDLHVAPFELLDSDELTIEYLSDELKEAKRDYEFEVDGIIISDINDHDRNIDGNPEYSIAFKETTEDDIKEAIVTDVVWDISKDGYMMPVVHIVPVKLAGAMVSKATAHHANTVVEKSIGIGTVIRITRSGDVIPKLLDVIKSSDSPLLPSTSYKWSDSNVDIINTDPRLVGEQLVKLVTYFVKTLDIKYMDEATFRVLVNEGLITSLSDVFYLDPKEMVKLDGFGEKKVAKIMTELDTGFGKMTLAELMAASNMFGRSLAKKKIKKIMDVYPDIILQTLNKGLVEKIDDIEGFDQITASQFVEGLPEFNEFLEQLPTKIKERMLQFTINVKPVDKSGLPLHSIKIVFTGFRDKVWKAKIESLGGEVGDSVSKNTTLVVAADPNDGGAKLEKAKKMNLPLIPKSNFISYMQSKYSVTI